MNAISYAFLSPLTHREASIDRLGLWLALSAAGLFVVTIAVGGVFTAMGLIDSIEAAGDVTGAADTIRFMLILSVSLSALALPVVIAARLIYRRPLASFLWPERRLSVRLLGLGAVTQIAAMLSVTALSWLAVGRHSSGEAFGPPAFWSEGASTIIPYVAVAAVAVLIAAAAEEVVFRGVLLQVSAGFLKSGWALCLLNGLIFAAIHLDPDPVAFIARTASGAVWAWAALRLGGLEFALGAHWAGNFMLALGNDFAQAVQPGRQFGLSALVVNLGVTLMVFLAIVVIARRDRRRPA